MVVQYKIGQYNIKQDRRGQTYLILVNILKQMSTDQLKHEIWLGCMQMPNCTPDDAVNYIGKALLFLNQPITPSGQSLLMVASSVGSYYIARECLLHGASVEATDKNGRTALHYAAAIGNLNIFEELVKEGANPLRQSIGGQTPLTKACIFCQGDIIEWYLNNELSAFEMGDSLGKKPLDMLKLAGDGLYEQVLEVYTELASSQMKQ